MKFTKEEYEKLFKKLEYTFKKSGDILVSKIENSEDLSDADLKKLLKKLEYRFRKSDDELVKKLMELTGEFSQQYSSIAAKKKRDEKEENKHIKEYNQFINDDYKK